MKRKTKEEIIKEVYELVGNEHVLVGEYLGYNTKTKFFHTVCNNYYEVRPNHFLNRNHRCTNCSNLKRKTNEQFINEISKLVGIEYTVLSTYYNNRTKVLMRHNTCGHEWKIRASAFVNDGQRCPQCNESKGENKIRQWLNKNNFIFNSQKEFRNLVGLGGKNLSYDFYIPEHNILIEYQGEYHDGTAKHQTRDEYERQKEHDKRKREYAKLNEIKLLEIWYFDFRDIEKILNSALKF